MAMQSTHVRRGVNFAGQEALLRAYSTVDLNDPIVAKWPSVRPEVIDVIKPLPWAVLSVVRGRYSSGQRGFYPAPTLPGDHPIVVVGAPTESQASWQDMAERIYSLCRAADLAHARVLFESIRFPLSATDPFDSSAPRFLEAAELAENIPMGSSFGPVEKDAQASASMGGTIMLQGKDEEPSALLLSVFHSFKNLVKEGT
jgi:hypothetical protein